jgi:hypothetical protein
MWIQVNIRYFKIPQHRVELSTSFIKDEWEGNPNTKKQYDIFLKNQYDIRLWHISNGLQRNMDNDWHSFNCSFILFKAYLS